jgi:membrane protein
MSGLLWWIIARARALIDKLLAVRIVESSVVLAAQAFLALFPLIIIAYAILPASAATGLLNEVQTHLGLRGDSTEALQKLLADRSSLQQSLSFLSVVIVIGSATAFTRALQRVYQYAWDLPKLGFSGVWRGLVWLIGIICYLGVIGSVAHVIHNDAVTTLMSAGAGFMLWWWTPFLLLGGRVCWRALLPGAVITTIAQLVVALVSVIYVPRMISHNESSYGPIGVVFAIESWLVIVAGVLVAGAAIGAVIGQNGGAFGNWIRGSSDPNAWRREVPKRRLRRIPSDSPKDQQAAPSTGG